MGSSGKAILWTGILIVGLVIVGTLVYLHIYDDSYRIARHVNTHVTTDDSGVAVRKGEVTSADSKDEHKKDVVIEEKAIDSQINRTIEDPEQDKSKIENKTSQGDLKPEESVKIVNESSKTGKDTQQAKIDKEKEKPIAKPREGPIPGEAEFGHDDAYKQYMQCPTTLRKKLQTSKIFKDRYIPDVPVLMYDEHITPEEYNRLKKFWGCYGWEYLSYEEVKSTLKYMNTPGHQYMFDAGLHLNKPNNTGCIRCAVVGGGGILNGSRKGKEIDDHDYVFRVNIAATGPYSVDVGSKTTHYAYTMTTLRNSLVAGGRVGFKTAPHDENIRYLVLSCEKADYIYIENRGAGKSDADFKKRDPKHRGAPRMGKTVTPADFKMTHPDFQRYMEFNWIQSKRKYKRINRPSTGALMLIAAIHTCDEVDVYGFGVSFEKYTTHYYDRKFSKFVYYANHDFKQELRLWNDLDKEGIINLYKGGKTR